MKKVSALVFGLATVAMTGPAMGASQTATVTVSAFIAGMSGSGMGGSCHVVSPGAIAYGTLDPLNATTVTPTVTQPEVHCTSGLMVVITDDLGSHEAGTQPNMSNGGAGLIPYSFGHAASATGAGGAANLPIALTANALPPSAYVGAPAGTYTDTITLTFTF